MNPIHLNTNAFSVPGPNQHICGQRDYVVVIDKSGSMLVNDMPNDRSRWEAAKETIYALAAKVYGFDPDGIDVWLFSSGNTLYRNVSPEKVKQIFQENEPCGSTAMAEVLNNALEEYFRKRDTGRAKPNGEIIFVVTDGEPDNQNAVIDTLFKAALRLRPSDHLAIHFLQIGHDHSASRFLKVLDEKLVPRGIVPYDFVKTTKIEEMEVQGITQTIMNLINETAQSKIAAMAQSGIPLRT